MPRALAATRSATLGGCPRAECLAHAHRNPPPAQGPVCHRPCAALWCRSLVAMGWL